VFFRQNPQSLIYFEFCEYLLWVQAIKVNSLVVSSKRIQRYERKLNICCANVKETRKNVTTKELQQRFTATKMADKTIQYNILARKHACAYYDINAAGTACWR